VALVVVEAPEDNNKMANIKIVGVLGITILVVVILVVIYYGGYNTAQANDEKVKKLVADVDTQLQRRYDLIPNLVQSVKGYMQFEKETLEQVTQLRSQWQASEGTDKIATGNQLEQTLSKLILTYESYPELKADETVTRLMDELAGTENRISVARTYYNDGVREHNLHLRAVPNSFFNESWDMKPYEIYQIDDIAKIAPKVDLTLK
jgi:LemA protein